MRLMRDLVGETFSHRYRLIARVAGGGMGEVYRGHDLLLDRAVAVKVLQPNLSGDPELVARFKAEARAAARLTHPNVVAVYDWGSEDEATYYMVMEYVSGTDLRDVLVTRGSVDVPRALEIVAGVCDALDAAHHGGLVHRDVKPENVLIARSGTVKVADFGIAAVADADRTQPGGAIPGTLRYLSPEQAAGREATAASDIWAAGALLCELVTGMPPLQGAGTELLRRRAQEPPVRPSAMSKKVPSQVDDLVMTACAVDPAARFQGATEMAAAVRRAGAALPEPDPLQDLLDEVTGEIRLPDMQPTDFAPRRVHRSRRKRRSVALMVLTALVLVAGARGVAAFLAPREVEVPHLVGLASDRAAEVAREAGFTIEVEGQVADLVVPEGSVITQEPLDGLLLEGEAIAVVVSTGPPPTRVPSLAGMTLDVAKVRLASRQLEVGDITRRFSLEPEGTVIEQRPEKGRVERGSTVHLVVSKGPRSIAVPDVSGMASDKATATLKDAGFKVNVIDVYSDDIAAERVVGTTPAGGTEAPEGSTIEVQRSLGPRYKDVVMPDVRNWSLQDARRKLLNLGLRVSVREVCTGGNVVADTDPLPGTKIKQNDRVALFVVCS